MMKKRSTWFSAVVVAAVALVGTVCHADLAAGTVTAGGAVQPNGSGGIATAMGQLTVGHSDDGTIWSGLITPDETAGLAITEIRIPENLPAAPGHTVSVPVFLKGLSPVAGLQAFIVFDAGLLEYQSTSPGSLISGDGDWEILDNVVEGHQLRLVITAKSATKTVTPEETKPIALLQFKIKPDASPGSVASLSFVRTTKIAAANGEGLPLRSVHGSLFVLALKPDLLIKKQSEQDSAYAIDNTYQQTPDGDQIETERANINQKATYSVKVENDGDTSTTYLVKATESNEPGWSVAYKVGETPVTSEITAPEGHQTATLAPGASEVLTVEVTPGSGVVGGTGKSVTLSVYRDQSDSTVRDAVQAITTTPPTVQFTSAIQTSTAESGNLIITAELSAPYDLDVTVPFTVSGTATEGTDYTITTSPITVPAGQATGTITIAINDDVLDEDDETIIVSMGDLTNAVKGTVSEHTATITDDDGSPSMSINDVTINPEGDIGTKSAVFTVSLSSPSGKTITVDYATANGSATASADYLAASGILTFAPGDTSKSVTVTTQTDVLDEADEAFTVNLSNPVNATIADSQGVGMIVDDDTPPTVSIDDVSVTEGNSGTTDATFTVSLSAASGKTVTVEFATADGTATAGSDYTAKSGTLTFNPGITTQSVSVAVGGDTTFEADETFTVTLSDPSNATIADGTGYGTILNDDKPPYQPDGLIANKTDGVYVGDNIYTPPDPIELQMKSQTVTSGGAAAVYYVKAQNDGTNIDNLKVTVPRPPAGWTVTWFSAKTAGTNITTQVTGTGWLTGHLTTGAFKEIRVEVKALASVVSSVSHSVLATVTSSKDASKKDAVKAVTTAYPPPIRKPDMMIRNASDASYLGNGIYNTTGLSQTKSQTVARNASATYVLRLQNDGNTTDSFKMTGPASGGGWTIQYYDAASGGTNITSSVTSAAGWSADSLGVGETRDFRLEVTPGSSVAVRAIRAVLVTGTSKNDGTKKDSVKASTRASSGRSEVNGPIGIEDKTSPSQRVQWLQAPPEVMAPGMNYPVSWQVTGGDKVSHTYLVMSTDPEATKKPVAMTETQSGKPGLFRDWVPAPSKGHLYYQAVAIVDGKMIVSEVVYAAVK